MNATITITLDHNGKVDVMHDIETLEDVYVKFINQKEEWVDTVTDVTFATESEQMEFVVNHYNEGFEDRAL
jgi:hypothetical protein